MRPNPRMVTRLITMELVVGWMVVLVVVRSWGLVLHFREELCRTREEVRWSSVLRKDLEQVGIWSMVRIRSSMGME